MVSFAFGIKLLSVNISRVTTCPLPNNKHNPDGIWKNVSPKTGLISDLSKAFVLTKYSNLLDDPNDGGFSKITKHKIINCYKYLIYH